MDLLHRNCWSYWRNTKPVGTIWIATAGPNGVKSKKLNLGYSREKHTCDFTFCIEHAKIGITSKLKLPQPEIVGTGADIVPFNSLISINPASEI